MLENSILWYATNGEVFMRTPRGDMNVTKEFSHEEYSSLGEESEETRYSKGLEGKGSEF